MKQKHSKEEPEKIDHEKEECAVDLLQQAKDESEQLRDKYLRLGAEFDNARKRWERERLDLVKFADFALLRELLVIVDEMEQGLKMIKEHAGSDEIIKGMELMFTNLWTTLQKRGLEKIDAVDKRFDPHLHEIVASRPVEGEVDGPTVLEEVQKGYVCQQRVLRTAKVIVGVPQEPSQEETSSEDEEGEE